MGIPGTNTGRTIGCTEPHARAETRTAPPVAGARAAADASYQGSSPSRRAGFRRAMMSISSSVMPASSMARM